MKQKTMDRAIKGVSLSNDFRESDEITLSSNIKKEVEEKREEKENEQRIQIGKRGKATSRNRCESFAANITWEK